MKYLLKAYLPNDHSRQVTAWSLVEKLIQEGRPFQEVMDLGCGEGNSVDRFQKARPGIHWLGLDIADSPESQKRRRTDCAFQTYDGKVMPLADNSFDLIYCRQVFEHVRFPREVLKEACRVLRPGGYLCGSASQLELFHSFSVWNYTPYGFQLLLEEAGFQLLELRPAMDVLTWVLRRILGTPKFFDRWTEKESPVNRVIGIAGRLRGKSHADINALKLLYACAFCFLAQKPAAEKKSA